MQIRLSVVKKPCAEPASIPEVRGIPPVLVLAALIFILTGITARQVTAEAPPDLYSASAPVPLNAVDCRLNAQILDVTIESLDEQVWATVEGQYLIENTNQLDSQTITMTIPTSLPGGLVFDPDHLTDFVIRVNGAERKLTPLLLAPSPVSSQVVTQAYALVVDLGAGSVAEIDTSYKQNLGDGDQIAFRFANSLGSRWPGTVSSSLMTFSLPDSLSYREQVLSAQPENMVFEGRKITRYDSDFEPKEDIELSFVNPALWKQIEQNRLTLMEWPNSPEAHYQLASLYKRVLPAWPVTEGSSDFESLMLAELETARELVGDRSGSLRCAIQAELASLYVGSLTDVNGQLSVSAASQALRELEDAVRVCPENELPPELRPKLEDLYLRMARSARTGGFYEEALSYLDQLGHLRTQRHNIALGSQEDLALERRLCYLAWIERVLATDDIERALLLAKEGEVVDALAVDSSLGPRFSSIQASISTDSAERKVELVLDFSALLLDTTPVVRDLEQMRQAWAGIDSDLTVSANALQLSLTIPFVNASDLSQKQSDIVRALPDWVELSFVRDILSPRGIEMVLSESWWEIHESYREIVDAYPTEAKLTDRQKACEAELARHPVEGSVESPKESEALLARKIKNHLIQRYQDDWKKLLQDSRAVFSIEWNPTIGGSIQRTWVVPAGQVQEMQLEHWTYNPPSIASHIGSYLLRALIVLIVLSAAVRLIVR